MPKHAAFYNDPPSGEYNSADQLALRREFARRLQAFMDDKGWNQAELARRTAEHCRTGKFGRDNVSSYIRAISLPGPVYLKAIAKALGVEKEDLLPSGLARGVDTALPEVQVRDAGDGLAHLKINQAVKWEVAIKVLELLKSDG